jgi:nucleotide-binding universal stress UspA family protein
MAYAEVLVHLDYTKACPERIKAAMSLAKRTDARVKGVALALQSTISNYLGIPLKSGLDESQKKAIEEAAQGIISDFEKAAKEEGVETASEIIRCGATQAPAQLAFHARHADISLMGQPNPDHESAAFLESLYEGVLFGSGRPVYLVPYYGRIDVQSRNAVIAWDGGKKAARAVRDAIPLLKGRGKTTILVINPETRSGAHGDKPGHDIAEYLKRHGVDAKVDRFSNNDISPDTLILNYLADNGADLLIMGAYGHARLREKAFGGVTNSIAHQMTAPVLMSD